MNFQIFKKLIALPLNSSERAITTIIAYYVQKDGYSSFPSYETIHRESGCANKTISKVIRTLGYAGIMERKHRANTLTGKEPNEYFFVFEGIRFTRDKLSKADRAAMDSKLKKLRTVVTKEMAEEARQKKTGPKVSSQMLRADTVTNVTKQNSQTVNIDVRANASSEGGTIPSQMLPIPSQMLRRSNNDNVPPSPNYQSQSTVDTTENQSQKQSTKVKSNNPTAPRKDPRDQSDDEWLADYDSPVASSYASIRG